MTRVWEAAGCPLPGQRPGEGETVGRSNGGDLLPRYHIASPIDTTTGSVKEKALYAGTLDLEEAIAYLSK